MSDRFQPISMDQLASWIFKELEAKNSVFGLPREMFFTPSHTDRFRVDLYGQPLETPFGVAAGPHSQMAQNIIYAWLCGARFMELKTVQTLDELDVSKPCIDIQDEGYNVEWSQELKVHQSFAEYLRAWILIHALHKKLGFEGDAPGTIFNMSVGYNLEGIKKDNVQWFLSQMHDAGDALKENIDIVSQYCPEVADITIPAQLSDNVCVSTMHGCPPDEIGKICHYLMEEQHLHTNVKLNPTLLGPEELRKILNEELGYREITVPDEAFGHDLKYPDAVELLTDLQAAGPKAGVIFGVKLCNTLEVQNHRQEFDPKETMMYMSGRPHHVIAANVARKLSEQFDGKLLMSFAGGVDAFNAYDLLRCGMKTITTCSDILKNGGYSRILQYIENTNAAMEVADAEDLDDYICKTVVDGVEVGEPEECALENLKAYAADARKDPLYIKGTYDRKRTKSDRELGLFDCIEAPCVDYCPIHQKVPDYMRLVRQGRFDEAVDITRDDNPMPTILGKACNHRCEEVCVRTHYDKPLAIREMKRFIMEHEKEAHVRRQKEATDVSVAIIGGGPCGLSAAYFLAQAGIKCVVFEAQPYSGGMVTGTIPSYRATDDCIKQDFAMLEKLGVEIRYNQKAGEDFSLADLNADGFKYIVLAAGAQTGMKLGIENEAAEGVLDGLTFLRDTREGNTPKLGARVGIIGGGDVAMDCARTADRLTTGQTTVIYRRMMAQMPTQKEELDGLLEEGIPVFELASPKRVVTDGGKITALECEKMELGEPDDSGRRRPIPIEGAEFEIPLDNLIIAIGQKPDFDFVDEAKIERNRKGYIEVKPETMETSVENIYAGGDAILNGPDTIVMACGDGKIIAEDICRKEDVEMPIPDRGSLSDDPEESEFDMLEALRQRGRREPRVKIPHLPLDNRKNFEEIVHTLSKEAAMEEAGHCLSCDKFCSICVSVCPNLAFMTYEKKSHKTLVAEQDYQVAVLTDFCNECGNCATFCPTSGAPYKDKPRLYLNRDEFMDQADNAFMIFKTADGWKIESRVAGDTHELMLEGDAQYKGPKFSATLNGETGELTDVEGVEEDDEVALKPCVEMFSLLTGLTTSMPHLPFATA